MRLRREGHSILRLNTMDPAVFDLQAPDPIMRDIVAALPSAQGYGDHQGMFAARRAVALFYETVPGFPKIDPADVWLGNGASELILMAMQALITSPDDEVVLPRPVEAIWPAAVKLAGGNVVFYDCDEQANWDVPLDQIAELLTDRTRALVLSHPNNPTGRVYAESTLETIGSLCEKRGVVLLSDETLGRILYRPTSFVPAGAFAGGTLCLTFDSLSFGYRAPGYRAGWMVIAGTQEPAPFFRRRFAELSDLRRSANTMGQNAVQVALGGRQTIDELTAPGGRLWEQREAALATLGRIDGLRCFEPEGGFSLFVGVDETFFDSGYERERFTFDLLEMYHVQVEPGECFQMRPGDYFRLSFLARERTFDSGARRIDAFLDRLRPKRL